ncbi:MAG: type II secretion system protein [Candidatus Margulisiibacteriota bacterium]
MKTRNAFTVIELLIVLTIISILISMVVLNFFKMQNEARAAKVSGDLRMVKIAAEAYAAKTGNYPGNLSDLLIESNVISAVPADTFNPRDVFGYSVSPDKNIFAVWSAGPNLSKGVITAWVGRMPVPADEDDIGITNGTPPNGNWR